MLEWGRKMIERPQEGNKRKSYSGKSDVSGHYTVFSNSTGRQGWLKTLGFRFQTPSESETPNVKVKVTPYNFRCEIQYQPYTCFLHVASSRFKVVPILYYIYF